MGRPLVVVSRPAERIDEAVAEIEARGLAALAAPLLEPVPLDGPAFAAFAEDLVANRVDIVVATSPSALPVAEDLAARRPIEEFLDLLRARHVVAIGPRTARSLEERGLRAGLVAEEHTSAGVARALARRVAGMRVALLRSAQGDPALVADLEAAGATVLDVPVYDLARPPSDEAHRAIVEAARDGAVAAWAFTSPLTVQRFFDLMDEADARDAFEASLRASVVGAIGPPTARALEAAGFPPDVVPKEATFPALVAAIEEAVGR